MKMISGMAVIALTCQAAAADVPPGHRSATPELVYQADLSREMARCALSRDRADAVQIVIGAPGTLGYDKALRHLTPDLVACLKGRRSATLDALDVRGAVAEALLHEHDDALLAAASSVAPEAPVRIAPGDDNGTALALFACITSAQPSVAAGVLRADPATPEEAAAFRKLGPTMQQCAPATGAIRVKSFQVRPMTAIALYRHIAAHGAAS